MIPSDVDVVRAATLGEAMDALRDRPDRRPLAGGTDLIVLLHQGVITVDAVLDLGPCDELRTMIGNAERGPGGRGGGQNR